MTTGNFEPDTLYYGDNLTWMKKWQDESIDLIYLDPPFNSNANYNMIFGTGAQVKAYDDTWVWGQTAVDDRNAALATTPSIADTINGFCKMLPETPMLAYLCHLAPRLYEMHRLLKTTGSLYLHCDDTSGHYIKILLDAVFRPQNYKNTITWRRATAHNNAKRYGRITDYILFYTKSDTYTWNGLDLAVPKTEAELKENYPSKDERGRYRSDNLTGPGKSAGSESAKAWKGYDVFKMGRTWAVPKVGAGQYADYIKEHFIPDYDKIEGIHDRLDALDRAGLIHHPKQGKWPGLKRYADADIGTLPQNLILKPIGFTNYSKGDEYLGYDTQKPEGLLRIFIKASSNPGDIVLDPYCGCGTTMRVCRDVEGKREANGDRRQFIGIDVTHIAVSIIEFNFKNRFGEAINVKGSPEDLDAAKDLFDRDPFQFEAWAVSKVAKLMPNEKKTGDRGVDGRGYFMGDDDKPQLVLAQVKGGKNISPTHIRDFIGTIENTGAKLGIFIVLENKNITKGMKTAIAKGNITVDKKTYPKIQIYSVEDYFAGRNPPSLPAILDSFTGKPPDLLSRS